MRIDILSVVPELLVSPLNHSIIKRAQDIPSKINESGNV